jgi:transcriptional regulator with XRE-family HTH domain
MNALRRTGALSGADGRLGAGMGLDGKITNHQRSTLFDRLPGVNLSEQAHTVRNVPDPTSPQAAVAALFRYLVREELKKPGVSLRSLATHLGVTHPVVRAIKDGTNQISRAGTIEQLAGYFKIPLADIHPRASAFGQKHPDLVAQEGGVAPLAVEAADPYPERAKAVQAAKALGIRADAIEQVRQSRWKAAERRDARWWLREIEHEAERLDDFDADPSLREAEDAKAERDSAELLRQEREHLKGRADDLKPPK